MRVDAHQHFWRYSPAEYGWIEPRAMRAIARDFEPADLAPHLAAHGLDGCVAVQARQHETENAYLLALADTNPSVKAVVGWVDLADPSVDEALDRWSGCEAFRGVRHIAQGEAPGFLLRDAFVSGVSRLAARDLSYDILIFANQLREAAEFVDRCPGELCFVLDHLAKPRMAEGAVEPWLTDLLDLAQRPNVMCKLSGMVTEAKSHWRPADIHPYIEAVLEAFGTDRVMYGSDWPVCLLAGTYDSVFDLTAGFIAALSESEQAAIMGDNASRFYKLESRS